VLKNLAVQAKSARLLYPEGLRSLLNANLMFTGTTQASSLTGRILIDSLSFTPDFDLSAICDQFNTGTLPAQPGFAETIQPAIALQYRHQIQPSQFPDQFCRTSCPPSRGNRRQSSPHRTNHLEPRGAVF
jgi:hypothetical protein